MKTLKLSIALAMSFAAILAVSGYVGYTGENANGVNNFKSHIHLACDDMLDDLCDNYKPDFNDDFKTHIHLASCADPMDDLCDLYKPGEKEIKETIGVGIFT